MEAVVEKEQFTYLLSVENPWSSDSDNDTVLFTEASECFSQIFFGCDKSQEIVNSFYSFKEAHCHRLEIDRRLFAQLVIDTLLKLLQDFCCFNVQVLACRARDTLFVLLTPLEVNLELQAEFEGYPLQLVPQLEDQEAFQEVPPYMGFKTVDVLQQPLTPLFKKYTDDQETLTGLLFTHKDRIRLTASILTRCFDMSLLKSLGLLKAEVALHQTNLTQSVVFDWGTPLRKFSFHAIPELRLYFGERVALYFAWLQYLLLWMIAAGVLSGCLWLYGEIFGLSSGFAFLAFVLPVYGLIYQQFWRRREAAYAWHWGTTHITEVERQRPGFKGKYDFDKVSRQVKKLRDVGEHPMLRIALSYLVSAFCVVPVGVFLVAAFFYKASLRQDSWTPTIVGLVVALQIKVFNYFYSKLAVWLTKQENHEFPSQYFDSLTLKLFAFQFVNSYTSLFYIAFAKTHFEGCVDQDCVGELRLQLLYIFLTNFSLNLYELLYPASMRKYRAFKRRKEEQRLLEEAAPVSELHAQVQAETDLAEYATPLSDYMEVVISLGYVLLFSATCPIITTAFVVLVFVELKVDAFKLTRLCQRPFPNFAHSVGVWNTVVETLLVISGLTNVGLIVFTFGIFDENNQWFAFVLLENAVLLVVIILKYVIPRVPTKVKEGLQWSERRTTAMLAGEHEELNPRLSKCGSFVQPSEKLSSWNIKTS